MKNKIILSSILTIALCLSMIAGSTFALFTSESKVDVSVSSATVSVTATPTELKMSSTLGTPLGSATQGTGDKANELTLENFVPGDFATFKINVKNDSTVAVKYRTVISISDDNGLAKGLVITIGDDVYTNTNGNGELASTDWTLINPTEGNTSVDVKIALPEEAGNDYQNKTCTLTYFVEAVQGNKVFETKVNSVEALVETLTNAEPGAVINAEGVTVDVTNIGASIPGGKVGYSIPAGVTIKNLEVVGSYRGGNYLTFEGVPGEEIVLENCTFEPSGRAMGVGFMSTEGGATSVVYNNCTFKGPIILEFVNNPDGVFTFNNCTFTKAASGNNYVMAHGGTHIFNGCTFDYTGVTQSNMGTVNTASVNCTSESDGSNATVVILNGCTRINCGTRKYGANSTLTIK